MMWLHPLMRFIRQHRRRVLIYGLVTLVCTGAVISVVKIRSHSVAAAKQLAAQSAAQTDFTQVVQRYLTLAKKLADYQGKGVDVTEPTTSATTIRQLLTEGKTAAATDLIAQTDTLLDQLLAKKQADDQAAEAARKEAEARLGQATGTISSSSGPLAGVAVSLFAGAVVSATSTTNQAGSYTLQVSAGTYTLVAEKSGYVTGRQSSVVVPAKGTVTVNLQLEPVPPAAPVTTSESTGNSSYERKTVQTDQGDFLTDIMTFAMGSVTMKTDTASDGDCTDDCPVLSLQNFAARNNASSGMNGTYFCPSDYGSCANETNAFFWKIYNSRLGKMINQSNGLGEFDPFITAGPGGIHYYREWNDWLKSGDKISAGINSKPRLIEGGQIVLDTGSLDQKERDTRTSRGAIGLKGGTLYAVITRGATIPNLAAVMHALGVDYATNVDGGGSSAMIYHGSYKVGPGRNLPNAILFQD